MDFEEWKEMDKSKEIFSAPVFKALGESNHQERPSESMNTGLPTGGGCA